MIFFPQNHIFCDVIKGRGRCVVPMLNPGFTLKYNRLTAYSHGLPSFKPSVLYKWQCIHLGT